MAAAPQDVFFFKNLNLQNTGKPGRDAYKDLILSLRQQLIGSRYFHDNPNSPLAHTWNSHNLPVLRPELAGPIPWFEVVLEINQTLWVRFRLRRDNLYVVGYRVHRRTTVTDQWQNEQWREFQEGGNHLIDPNSIFLPFGGGYPKLVGYGKISLAETHVGQQDLIRAVDRLATPATTDAVRAQSLIVVIFMISEAVRFRHVLDFVAQKYLESSRVDSNEHQLAALVNDWNPLSTALLRVDAGFDFLLPELNSTRIKREMDAVDALGILKYYSFRH